ncbi:MAG: hypothetical protein H6R00_4688 [Proteobacteria bacterium]|nr:hypothetical protein [Pseudomonadota bacterium]
MTQCSSMLDEVAKAAAPHMKAAMGYRRLSRLRETAVLPQACRAAMMSADHMMTGSSAVSGGASDVSHAMPGMDATKQVEDTAAGSTQRGTLDAVNRMHKPMMATANIAAPDLAFNCGMLVHHQGAIDMARIELKYGKDPASRKMAEMIIDAQTKEITEMSARFETMTKQRAAVQQGAGRRNNRRPPCIDQLRSGWTVAKTLVLPSLPISSTS